MTNQTPVTASGEGREGLRESMAQIVSGAPYPSKRSLAKADRILALPGMGGFQDGIEAAAKYLETRAAEWRKSVVGTSPMQAMAQTRYAEELERDVQALRARPTTTGESGL